jgi:hypothetical protein
LKFIIRGGGRERGREREREREETQRLRLPVVPQVCSGGYPSDLIVTYLILICAATLNSGKVHDLGGWVESKTLAG